MRPLMTLWLTGCLCLTGCHQKPQQELAATPPKDPPGQWVMERYSAEKGYTFRKDGVTYQAHCWATETDQPGSRILVSDVGNADVCVSVALPYIHKVIPLEQSTTRTMWTGPDMLYLTEPKSGLRYIFIITEAK